MIKPVWGSTDKPLACKALASQLAGAAQFDGLLYIGYPILGTPEGSFPLDALLVSPTLGVVIFDVVEGKGLSNYIERQDGAFSKMQSKLLQHQGLIKNRRLVPPINTVTFAPAMPAQALPLDGERPICRTDSLLGHLETIEIPPFAEYSQLLSVVQAIFTLRRGRKKRLLQKMESRGAKTKKLEDSIANLDSRQSEAVVETYDGVQRIRGLAGSGKTIVLALKVAYLHARHPEWLIAVTFHTTPVQISVHR